jgi:hypothetical protein
MNLRSHIGKEFIVISNDARVRQEKDLAKLVRYAVGDELPAGKQVGDIVIIPKRATVFVLDTKTDASKNTYALLTPAREGAPAFGWTMATNLEGGMMNETTGVAPTPWDLIPQGDNYTVIDARALLRGRPPEFAANGNTLPVGTYVVVTGKSEDGKFVNISRAKISNEKIAAEEDLGWTATANLMDGCSTVFSSPAWADIKGSHACWERGRCTGQKILVNIVGTGGEMEQVTLDTLPAYEKLRDAAARDRVMVGIESGFRTFAKQQELFDGYTRKLPGFNLAAAPGKSSHQNGCAFDLNTRGFDGHPVYDWMKRNAPAHGFIRTVNKEHWHWEYRPTEAASLHREGLFARSNVKK